MNDKIKPYKGAAGGWGSLKATTKSVLQSKKTASNIRNLLKVNQVKGFDCPGCAWGDQIGHPFGFCENGAKAVTWEATSRTVDREFFAQHSITALRKQSDYYLEYQGRLTEPMRYNPKTDHYEPVSWEDAFALIADKIQGLDDINQLELYTSGRASNEASYIYQLFGRVLGTNNFPDCSNMCHEASGVGLGQSLGVGKGTVRLEDFEKADAIFVFGQNPGTNHPRMLHSLRSASRKGTRIVSFNTLRERGLERFSNPQSPLEMLTPKTSRISSAYYCPNLGGDMAAIRGMVKHLLAADRKARAEGAFPLLNDAFLNQHTQGVEDYLRVVDATSWEQIEQQSGLSREQLAEAAEIYWQSEAVICTWAMGITQHKHSVASVREIVNLQLLRANLGRPGAGLCPVRGHSNVQGNRTMGINERPSEQWLTNLESKLGIPMPRKPGHNTVEAIHAMSKGQAKVFIALGGNFAAATPDTERTARALRNCELTVQISTKLNRSHLEIGKEALILPTLGRTQVDRQATRPQFITVEDSFSMVHASEGVNEPHSELQRSETAIIAGIAHASMGDTPIDWLALAADYNKIRELIARTIPGFESFGQKLDIPGGFYLGNAAADYCFATPSQKAEFCASSLPDAIVPQLHSDEPVATLQTLRSHDQYNTTIYGMDDRYRGVYGQRMVLFISPEDLQKRGLSEGELVEIEALWPDGIERKVGGFKLVSYDIPEGNLAAYYPETNPLVPLESVGDETGTPTSKSIAVVIRKQQDNQRIF
ncbi:FdhF/YdeP family oxidoreductase [Dongshaea marina]|uniref:FdhF/YdeP family oxidoreductase n=1 Tax=Dongshaea marina TaxID=2047966 RepID=UPI000D3E364C|nr:FdhF/YdeP family oxidoreductase [Dongshaea marina]